MPDVASCCQLSRVCCRGRALAGAAAAQLGSQQSAWAWQYLYFGCSQPRQGQKVLDVTAASCLCLVSESVWLSQ